MAMAAEKLGYLTPEKKEALEAQLARTQAELERLGRGHPDWAAEVDAAIAAFNASDIAAARDAFARIDDLIAERRAALLAEEATLRLEAARSKHAQATLLYPFEVSKAEPLLTRGCRAGGDQLQVLDRLRTRPDAISGASTARLRRSSARTA